MPLTISAKRCQDIRRRLIEARLQKLVTNTINEPGETTFGSVDQFFEHLDALTSRPTDRPPRSAKKGL